MELEKLSVRELVARMKLGQLWVTIGVIGGIVAGSFNMGYRLSAMVSEGRLNSQNFELRQATSNLEALRKKDQFLSLFLRYEQSSTSVERKSARAALDGYIGKFIDAAEKAESKVQIGKGTGRQTTIVFSDGSTWTVPPDFRSAAKR